MDLTIIIDNLLYEMRRNGIVAEVRYTYNRKGGIVSFEVKIVGFLE